MYKIISTILYIGLNLILRKVKVQDKKYLPKDPKFIVSCTHTSMVEIVVLAIAVYPHELHYMAKQELFEKKFLRWFFTSNNAFPVNRANPGPSTLKIPVKLLKEGKTIGMFPGGSRTEGAPVKRGAATIAAMSKAPIIPAAYYGPRTFKDLVFSKQKAYIKFGTPIQTVDYLAQFKKNEAIDHMTEQLEKEMTALSTALKNK